MNAGQARVRRVQAGAVFVAAALVAGCGNQNRPVAVPDNGSGPASQPVSLAVVVSAPTPSTTQPGIVTIIDYSGDTISAEATIGVGPIAFSVNANGANGYSLNSDNTLSNFPVSLSTTTQNVLNSTVPSSANIVNLFSPSSGLFAADLDNKACTGQSACNPNVVDVFSGSPEDFVQAIPVTQSAAAVVTTPVMVVGPSVVSSSGVGQRDFAISQNIPSLTPTGLECNVLPLAPTFPNGAVTGIETTTDTADAPIPVGRCPVYAVESPDLRRLFVLNRGDDTISVINTLNDTLDTGCPPPPAGTGCVNSVNGLTYFTHPTLPLSQASLTADNAPVNCTFSVDPTCGGMPLVAGPVYAEYNAATSQLWVANYDGSTVSVIDVSTDPKYGFDSAAFGTTHTVAVGKNPASLTVLHDGSRGYTANQTDGTVSIVDYPSVSIEKQALSVNGHPRTVVSTQNSEYAKVYVASPDSSIVTIIDGQSDTVDKTLNVQGNVVDVRVSSQNAVSGNNLNVSRAPGFGQPCNLPLSKFPPSSSSTLANCQAQQ